MSFRVAIYSFTENGKKLSESIATISYKFRDEKLEFEIVNDTMITCESFHMYDGHIFVSAVGIAVRKIAPFIESKLTDPAVIVVDERAQYIIPILSGHIGGANDLSSIIADALGAEAIITTATDVNGYRAIDSIASDNGMVINNKTGIKHINAKILTGEEITIFSDKNVDVIISSDKSDENRATLHIFNRRIVLGIGCRKNIDEDIFESTINEVLKDRNLSSDDVEIIASIELKSDEKAINSYAKKYGIKFITYSADELSSVTGNFDESEFVKSVTGVSNVSERAAAYAGGSGHFIEKRLVKNGITVSIYERKKTIEL